LLYHRCDFQSGHREKLAATECPSPAQGDIVANERFMTTDKSTNVIAGDRARDLTADVTAKTRLCLE
jgi:hypothetical protein